MTVGFDRTADCQGNHPSLTEFLRILTEHYWLCFDRTTSLTEHLGNLGFDRTVNGEMFCQKNVISRVFCHICLPGFYLWMNCFQLCTSPSPDQYGDTASCFNLIAFSVDF